MKINDIKKEELIVKQTYKEIKRSKKHEKFSGFMNKISPDKFKYIAVNIILAIVISFVVYSDLKLHYFVNGMADKIATVMCSVSCVAAMMLFLVVVESKIQDIVITKKLNKMSYKKMQYIPLTKAEFIKLEIHNINDYITFLNEFLKVRIDYLSFSELIDVYRTTIAPPPKMIIDKINESLIFLENLPESGQQIGFNDVKGFIVKKGENYGTLHD